MILGFMAVLGFKWWAIDFSVTYLLIYFWMRCSSASRMSSTNSAMSAFKVSSTRLVQTCSVHLATRPTFSFIASLNNREGSQSQWNSTSVPREDIQLTGSQRWRSAWWSHPKLRRWALRRARSWTAPGRPLAPASSWHRQTWKRKWCCGQKSFFDNWPAMGMWRLINIIGAVQKL